LPSLSALVDQILEAKPPERDPTAHLANALGGLASFRTAESCLRRHEACNRLSVPCNNHLFALLDQIEQLTKPVFCLEGADLLMAW